MKLCWLPQEGQKFVKKKTLVCAVLEIALASMLLAGPFVQQAFAGDDDHDNLKFKNGTLVVSRSVYAGDASSVTVGQTLPPGCVAGTITLPLLGGGTTTVKVKCAKAVADGTYPTVFNNDGPDGSFGITSPIFLDNLKTDGRMLGTLAVPYDKVVTSFS